MQLEQSSTSPYSPVELGEVSLAAPPKRSGALKIVCQDAERAEQWLQSKQWVLRWREIDRLYESPSRIDYWEGTNIPRAHLSTYTIAQHVKSLEPQIMGGLFSDDPPFMLNPRPGTKQDTTRAIAALLGFQLEDCGFREELRLGVRDCLVFGTSIWKWGWESCTRKRSVYERSSNPIKVDAGVPGAPQQIDTDESDDINVREVEEQIERPTFENVPLRHVYVDPGCRVSDIRKAKFVIHRIKLSGAELNDLRDVDGYDIPSEAELTNLLFPPKEDSPTSSLESLQTSNLYDFQAVNRDDEEVADPTQERNFELLERWDNNKVITVLNRKLVIRNGRNPFGKIPFCSVSWWDIPNAFYGMGLGHILAGEQRLQAATINARLDQMSLNLNRGFLRVKGKNVPTQNIRMRPGGIIDVDDPNSLKPMEKIDAVAEAYVEVQASEARAEGLSGANELLVQGNMPDKGRTSLGRTATGANLLAGGSQSRMEAFIERIGDQVFEPTLDAFHEMNRMMLPMSVLRRLLNEELREAYTVDHLEILNARITFDVSAAARLSSRRQMAQSLPFLLQGLLTDPVHTMLGAQGKKVNIGELVSMLFDVSGWKNKADVIQDMTDEDEQRAAMSNPAAQQLMLAQQKAKANTDGKLQEIDSENAARAYRELQRQVIEKQLETEAVTGQPSNSGFGS